MSKKEGPAHQARAAELRQLGEAPGHGMTPRPLRRRPPPPPPPPPPFPAAPTAASHPPTRVGATDGEDVVGAGALQRQHVHRVAKQGAARRAEAAAVAGAWRQRAGVGRRGERSWRQQNLAGRQQVATSQACQGAAFPTPQAPGPSPCPCPCPRRACTPARSCASRAHADSKDMPRSMVRSWRRVGRAVRGSTHSSCRVSGRNSDGGSGRGREAVQRVCGQHTLAAHDNSYPPALVGFQDFQMLTARVAKRTSAAKASTCKDAPAARRRGQCPGQAGR